MTQARLLKNNSLITAAQFVLLGVITVLTYGHTLDVPFYMDDYSSLVDNSVFYDAESISEFYKYASLRVVGYTTFWINFYFHHFEVAGYHVVNIGIHFLTSVIVMLLTGALLKAADKKKGIEQQKNYLLPLFVALLFLVHPLQTQAVTYIIQRLASLTALFCLTSLYCYIYARLAKTTRKKILLFCGAAAFFTLSLFTKQNSITLPFVLLITELLFFQKTGNRGVWKMTITACILVLSGMIVMFYGGWTDVLHTLDTMTRETTKISRLSYFYTQVGVIWQYIRMFFIPTGLHLDHEVAVLMQANAKVIASITGHLLCIITGIVLIKKYPILSFSIFFYYTAHLVESSIIPIRDVFFEHRTYLPNFGLCLFTGIVLFNVLPQWISKKKILISVTVVLTIFASLTRARNEIWRDPILLWRDSAEHAPNKERPWNELGKYLLMAGRLDEAIEVLVETAKSRGTDKNRKESGAGGYTPSEEASVNLMMALSQRGEVELAFEIADNFLKRTDVSRLNRSKMLTNKGNLFAHSGNIQDAEKCYKQAVRIFPKNIMPQNNLGLLYMIQGRYDDAEQAFLRVLKIDPEFALSREKLQEVRKLRSDKK